MTKKTTKDVANATKDVANATSDAVADDSGQNCGQNSGQNCGQNSGQNIREKLMRIQAKLKAPKTQWNDFGGFSYRSCEDILEAVKPLLLEENLLLSLSDKLVNIGDRYYIKATVTLRDDKGEIYINGYAREEETKKGMDGSQITGASSSYARKYALNGMFLIDDARDSDVTNKGEQNTPAEKTAGGKASDKTKVETNIAGPAVNDNDAEVTGVPVECTVKSGVGKNNKAWTKYSVMIDDEWYGTFSDTLGEVLKDAEAAGDVVRIMYQVSKGYRNITRILKL